MRTVPVPGGEPWLDSAAGLLRPYSVTNGRTRPNTALSLVSMVRATGNGGAESMTPEHVQALECCRVPRSVAEVAAHLRQPVVVTKILLSDLISCQAVTTRSPATTVTRTDDDALEALLDGLQRL